MPGVSWEGAPFRGAGGRGWQGALAARASVKGTPHPANRGADKARQAALIVVGGCVAKQSLPSVQVINETLQKLEAFLLKSIIQTDVSRGPHTGSR